ANQSIRMPIMELAKKFNVSRQTIGGYLAAIKRAGYIDYETDARYNSTEIRYRVSDALAARWAKEPNRSGKGEAAAEPACSEPPLDTPEPPKPTKKAKVAKPSTEAMVTQPAVATPVSSLETTSACINSQPTVLMPIPSMPTYINKAPIPNYVQESPETEVRLEYCGRRFPIAVQHIFGLVTAYRQRTAAFYARYSDKAMQNSLFGQVMSGYNIARYEDQLVLACVQWVEDYEKRALTGQSQSAAVSAVVSPPVTPVVTSPAPIKAVTPVAVPVIKTVPTSASPPAKKIFIQPLASLPTGDELTELVEQTLLDLRQQNKLAKGLYEVSVAQLVQEALFYIQQDSARTPPERWAMVQRLWMSGAWTSPRGTLAVQAKARESAWADMKKLEQAQAQVIVSALEAAVGYNLVHRVGGSCYG
ncbi:MAG: helix-turn-helix domain-containing protein, partial [Pseudomonadota bacterium]